MLLYIDTRTVAQARVGLVSDDGSFVSQATLSTWKTGRVLTAILRLLRQSKLHSASLRGIFIEAGPGFFSPLRSGVIIANTLAFSKAVPVFPLIGKRNGGINQLPPKALLARALRTSKSRLAIPQYGTEPNITQPKRRLGVGVLRGQR